jgi:hypothetical protein
MPSSYLPLARRCVVTYAGRARSFTATPRSSILLGLSLPESFRAAAGVVGIQVLEKKDTYDTTSMRVRPRLSSSQTVSRGRKKAIVNLTASNHDEKGNFLSITQLYIVY